MVGTKQKSVISLAAAALCLALALLLPSLFHAVGAGPVFLPMHLPVLLCGLLCGWCYGAGCGLLAPLLSSFITGMPALFPTAPAMMLELCAYGLLTGLLYRKLRWKLYPALLAAMLGGRLVSGLANALFLGFAGKPYGIEIFLSGAFVTALPGILLQLLLVPLLLFVLQRAGVVSRPAVQGAA